MLVGLRLRDIELETWGWICDAIFTEKIIRLAKVSIPLRRFQKLSP